MVNKNQHIKSNIKYIQHEAAEAAAPVTAVPQPAWLAAPWAGLECQLPGQLGRRCCWCCRFCGIKLITVVSLMSLCYIYIYIFIYLLLFVIFDLSILRYQLVFYYILFSQTLVIYIYIYVYPFIYTYIQL